MQKFYLTTKISIIILIIFLSQKSNSQCQVSHANNGTNVVTSQPFLWGQGFIAECDGDLEFIQLVSDGTGIVSAGTLSIYNGNTVNGTPIYTQPYPSIAINNIGDPIRIDVTGTLTLTQNAQYTFEFIVDNVDVLADFNGGYTGGSPFQDGIEYDTVDLIFEVALVSPTLSNDEFDNKLKITLFPNPSNDYISISNLNEKLSYSIINALGQEVSTGTISSNETVDIRNLNNGLYIMKFNNGNTLKFLKK